MMPNTLARYRGYLILPDENGEWVSIHTRSVENRSIWDFVDFATDLPDAKLKIDAWLNAA